MKFLIVLGFFPLFSASPLWMPFYPNLDSIQDLGLQTDSLISTLRNLDQDPKASQAIKRVFNKDTVCLNNMEEAIEAIQEGSRLVEAAEGDLRTLTSRVESLMELTGEAEVVRELATIFRALDSLLTKLAPANTTICSASFDSTTAYINSLAVMMNEFALQLQFELDPRSRGMFKESARVLAATNGFLRNLRSQNKEFQNFCLSDKESSTRGVRGMGKIITSLADLSATIGNLEAAEEMRKGNVIIEKISTQMQNMKDFNIGLNCSVRDFKSAAATMDDLANIIQDVGIDNLKNQLGIDLDFAVLGQY